VFVAHAFGAVANTSLQIFSRLSTSQVVRVTSQSISVRAVALRVLMVTDSVPGFGATRLGRGRGLDFGRAGGRQCRGSPPIGDAELLFREDRTRASRPRAKALSSWRFPSRHEVAQRGSG
jgi:hypothetical protein